MNCCFLSLGSNQKNPQRQIRRAVRALNALPRTNVLKKSRLHQTKAWGLVTQQDFYNSAVKISTYLPPFVLLRHCQHIEKKIGRTRKKHWGPRVIDIDIILYANRITKSKKLTIPHPYFLHRDFVLIPLREINSE